MSSMNWEEYLSEVIITFRKEFEKLSPEEQKIIREKTLHRSLLEPCQIEVLDAGTRKSAVWFVIHDDSLTDMTFKVHRNVKSPDVSEFWQKYKFRIANRKSIERTLSSSYEYHNVFMQDVMVGMPRAYRPQEITEYLLSSVRTDVARDEQVNAIKRSTEGLKKGIAKIPEENVRNELLAVTKKIDGALGEIKRIDEDVGKVRQLVGITKEIQDWRLLVSDVDRLREEHVPREVFESKLRELSTKIEAYEKIEKAYERLSSQQEKVLEQQSSFLKWIKYSTILVPIAVALIPIIEIVVRHLLNV